MLLSGEGMKKQRIYLDTSVIGGCFDAEFARWSDALVRDFREEYFAPVVSGVVAAEIALAPAFVQERYAEILGLGAEVLEESDASDALADRYRSTESCPCVSTRTRSTSRSRPLGRSTWW